MGRRRDGPGPADERVLPWPVKGVRERDRASQRGFSRSSGNPRELASGDSGFVGSQWNSLGWLQGWLARPLSVTKDVSQLGFLWSGFVLRPMRCMVAVLAARCVHPGPGSVDGEVSSPAAGTGVPELRHPGS